MSDSLKRTLSMEDLVSELQCSVCLDLFQQPVILPCSHILCTRPCAERLFQHNFIRCPVCRENCYIPGGVQSLPRVITLDNIIDRYQNDSMEQDAQDDEEEIGRRDIPCQLCRGSPRKAKKSCVDCNASYCSSCLALSHPNKEPFIHHVLTEPKRNPRPKQVQCSQHGDSCTIYCEVCRALVCQQCLQDSHVGHSTVAIEAAYNRLKPVLDTGVQDLIASQETIAETIKLHEEVLQYFKKKLEDNIWQLELSQQAVIDAVKNKEDCITRFKESIDRHRTEVNEQCNSLITEIEHKRSFFLSDLEFEERSQGDAIQVQIDTLKKKLADSQSLAHYAKEILQENDCSSFLQLADGVSKRVVRGKLNPDDLVAPDPTFVQLNNRVLDLRKERAVLREIHYLSAPAKPVIDIGKCSRSDSAIVLVIHPALNDSEIVDGYKVWFCSEQQRDQETKEEITFVASNDERKFSKSVPTGHSNVLILENLDVESTYYVTVQAINVAGESEVSDIVHVTTLAATCEEISAPEITTNLCRTFTSAIQIYSTSPFESEEGITHYLLYREAMGNKTWKSFALYGRLEHRVFGLKHNTEYECAIWACNTHGDGQISAKVYLKTEGSGLS